MQVTEETELSILIIIIIGQYFQFVEFFNKKVLTIDSNAYIILSVLETKHSKRGVAQFG